VTWARGDRGTAAIGEARPPPRSRSRRSQVRIPPIQWKSSRAPPQSPDPQATVRARSQD